MIHAHWAMYHRTAAGKNFGDAEWLDSGLRDSTEAGLMRQWESLPARFRDWQETSMRLVPIEDSGFPFVDDDDEETVALEG